MFDGNVTLVKSLGDPAILSVFGIQDINGLVNVAYAIPNVGAGGFIDPLHWMPCQCRRFRDHHPHLRRESDFLAAGS